MNRRAKTYISMDQLAGLINLPPGLRPLFMHGLSDPPGVYLVVEGKSLPEVVPGAELPLFGLLSTVEHVEVDGKRFSRIVVAPSVEAVVEQVGAVAS